tara:strand:+ start:128 stop:304 length:177 start_codon:yes stop_codon:yes gene_type:complete
MAYPKGTGRAAVDTIKAAVRQDPNLSPTDTKRVDQTVADLDYWLKKNDGGMVSKTRTY